MPSKPNRGWLDATAAAELLGVKRATLYAYVSRGLVRRAPSFEGRGSRYSRSDLERLRLRKRARSGHGPVAAGALNWGEPVLDSEITEIRPEGHRYRGYAAIELARSGVPFEQVFSLLVSGTFGDREPWPSCTLGVRASVLRSLSGQSSRPIDRVVSAFSAVAPPDPAPDDPESNESVARILVRRMVATLGAGGRVTEALSASSVARSFLVATAGRTDKKSESATNEALVLVADHELNQSCFSARITASAGASLRGAVSSALATITGSKHGAACDRVEALVDRIARPEFAAREIKAVREGGEAVVGFGHTLYPGGDPRAERLLELAFALGNKRELRVVRALVDAVDLSGGEQPSLEVGLVALGYALRLPPGGALALFAVGRTAGWIAHALEQRESPLLLRPRARYVGPEARALD